jgi:hypothetical protein
MIHIKVKLREVNGYIDELYIRSTSIYTNYYSLVDYTVCSSVVCEYNSRLLARLDQGLKPLVYVDKAGHFEFSRVV